MVTLSSCHAMDFFPCSFQVMFRCNERSEEGNVSYFGGEEWQESSKI